MGLLCNGPDGGGGGGGGATEENHIGQGREDIKECFKKAGQIKTN